MSNINKVVVSGNITREPELRQTATGTSVLSFGIASNESRKNSQTGEWENYAHFFECTAFGNLADGLSKFLTKGMKVLIDGKLQFSQWEKDGQKHSRVSIVIASLDPCTPKQNANTNTQQNTQPTQQNIQQNQQEVDDLPF